MSTPHPLVVQLRFTRAEFLRGLRGVSAQDARVRLGPTNSIGWNVGHLAWQEQRYFLDFAHGQMPYPDIAERFAYLAPGSTPPLSEMLRKWRAITQAADPWLDTLTVEEMFAHPIRKGRPLEVSYGNLLQRVIYHYWYHNGENQAIRQQLGHRRLPQFVGNIDDQAPYRPDVGPEPPA